MLDHTDPAVAHWYRHNTHGRAVPDIARLLDEKSKAGVRVGVCLPALDEEATVGTICTTILEDLVAPGLVDRLVVMDSGSTDDTATLATAAGAEVFRSTDVLPEIAGAGGKGDSLWKSLAVVDCDIVLWVDSDTVNFESHFVTALLAPLLASEELLFVKGYYERPLVTTTAETSGGGRVTEIAIRPLLNLLYPALSGFIQPLSGEYGGRREALLDIPFRTGYDVDVVLLVDLVERYGLGSMAQVDLGRREHRNRDTEALGRMSFEVTRGLLARLEEFGDVKVGELPDSFVQFVSEQEGWGPRGWTTSARSRPPMRSLLA